MANFPFDLAGYLKQTVILNEGLELLKIDVEGLWLPLCMWALA
jgi:hypothetical protein